MKLKRKESIDIFRIKYIIQDDMKKIIKSIFAMVICLSVVLTAFSMTAFAATDATTSAPAYTIEGGTVAASADIDNSNGSATANVMLVLAQYEGTILKSAVIGETSVSAGATGTVEAEADEVSGATVKCYVWEKSTLAPLPIVAAELPAHAINTAFTDVKSYFYNQEQNPEDASRSLTRSTNPVATAVGGDGYLYTNLHVGTAALNANLDSSPANTDWVEANSGTYRYISAINDTAAIGADFFIFGGGNSGTALWNTKNTAIAALNTGDTWVSFTLDYPATVAIYVPGGYSQDDYEAGAWLAGDGWSYSFWGSDVGGAIVTNRKTDTAGHTNTVRHKLSKDFPAGTVTIPFDAALKNCTQSPIITVVPR